MNGAQKLIKVCAIVFAIMLSISIISGIVAAALGIGALTYYQDNKHEIVTENFSKEYDGIKNLDINIAAANIYIKKGDKFKVEGKNIPENYVIEQDGDTLKIVNDHVWRISTTNNTKITVYVPEKLRKFSLDIAAGTTSIDGINAEAAIIQAGAGEVKITNSELTNLKLEAGVGKTTFEGILKGENRIECGVGEVNINLIDGDENYSLNLEKGLGNISLNGKSVPDEYEIGDGENTLEVEGGVGSININY